MATSRTRHNRRTRLRRRRGQIMARQLEISLRREAVIRRREDKERKMLVLACWKYRRAAREAARLLRQDERIESIRAHAGILSFRTHWIYAEVLGRRFRIGRFRVTLPPVRNRLQILHIASGAMDPKQPPLYTFPNWKPPTFCFGSGSRAGFLDELINGGEFVPAVYLILDSFASINEGDESRALKHYCGLVEIGE